jgi:hypothetical protein
MGIVESIWQFFASYPLWARVVIAIGLMLAFFTAILVKRTSVPLVVAPPPTTKPITGAQVVFDGRGAIDGFAIKGQPGYLWTGTWPNSTRAGKIGEGELAIELGGVLNIKRSNTDGRFELVVKQYSYGGQQHSVLPKDEVIAGKRKLQVACLAKVVGGEHTLRFVVNATDGEQLAHQTHRVIGNEWKPINVYLEAPATKDAEVRIYDEQITGPSSVQIKDLVITQRES